MLSPIAEKGMSPSKIANSVLLGRGEGLEGGSTGLNLGLQGGGGGGFLHPPPSLAPKSSLLMGRDPPLFAAAPRLL